MSRPELPQRMKIEKAAQIVTRRLDFADAEQAEAWSVIADIITERAQSPDCCRARHDVETYREKVRVG